MNRIERANRRRGRTDGGSGTAKAAAGAGRDRGRNRLKPDLLVLEDRRLLATFTVTNPGDTVTNSQPASGTLRWAVEQANLASTPSTINFSLGSGPQTVTLAQLLDPVELTNTTEPITITGPGASLLTINGNNEGAVLRIDQGVTRDHHGPDGHRRVARRQPQRRRDQQPRHALDQQLHALGQLDQRHVRLHHRHGDDQRHHGHRRQQLLRRRRVT